MNNPLQQIILDWIGKDKKVSSMFTGYDNPDAMYNEALSDLRDRVPELVKLVTQNIQKTLEKKIEYPDGVGAGACVHWTDIINSLSEAGGVN